ncbi:hypothetical protein Pyrde_0592 [Pyrodictium delaneyi]|uniref:Uncharacterized protein n=1 Tax=Pyrodictium delaneyi TaxID=1273541 RepID=A0A0P0N2P9_9CREN|nr:hypothetical protein [Pyrodictium delaneyi]ALL00642.1 hypothetical protein Pyrde_0592 [Pyrodictium delaneyi]OWJ54096.1 hypothetical protein Pdsh_09565 [Pyrodictium delaneyi]
MKPIEQYANAENEFNKLKSVAIYYLTRMYSKNSAWALTAWPIEKLAGESLEGKYAQTLESLRRNLYHYLSEIGAEWTEVDEETGGFNILLPGTYIEAAKALQTLWLSLHLVYMTSANEPQYTPDITDLYTLYSSYISLAKKLYWIKGITFRQANSWLETAAYIALLIGPVTPDLFETLMLEKPIATIISALTLYMKG